MEIAHVEDEKGIVVPAPYRRSIRALFAPDRGTIEELTLSVVNIEPGQGTPYHVHDRPETIFVIAGFGRIQCEGQSAALLPGTAAFIRTGERHEVTADSEEMLTLATIFVPGYKAADLYRISLDAEGDG